MSTILGNPITLGGGGAKLNIDFGATPPSDTSKLWVPLEKKPDAVECSPVLNYGSEYLTSTPLYVPTDQAVGAAMMLYGDYLYVLGGRTNVSPSSSGDTNKITKFNIKAGTGETISAKLSSRCSSMFYTTVGNKLYMIGGLLAGISQSALRNIDVFDPVTETVTKVGEYSAGIKRDGIHNLANSCFSFGSVIYIMGFQINNGTHYYSVSMYDTETKTETIAPFQAQLAGACYSQPIGGKVYAFAGTNSQNSASSNYYEYNLLTNTVTQKGAGRNVWARIGSVAFSVGKYVYIFRGHDDSQYQNNTSEKIERYDTENNTFTTLSYTQPDKAVDRITAFDGESIYLGSGVRSLGGTSIASRNIFKFTAQTNLTKNHLFLQEDYGYDFLWSAIKSKDADFKVKVINAYLGGSDNFAHPTNAYLYDTNTNQWKSLSGESYVSDMLNALNIMGVN